MAFFVTIRRIFSSSRTPGGITLIHSGFLLAKRVATVRRPPTQMLLSPPSNAPSRPPNVLLAFAAGRHNVFQQARDQAII